MASDAGQGADLLGGGVAGRKAARGEGRPATLRVRSPRKSRLRLEGWMRGEVVSSLRGDGQAGQVALSRSRRAMAALACASLMLGCDVAESTRLEPTPCVRREYFEAPARMRSRHPTTFNAAFCAEYGWQCRTDRNASKECNEI